MLTQVEAAKQKWGGAHQAIDTWLIERKQLLVQYCQLLGLPPYESTKGTLPSAQDIEEFCLILMDYISAGHFEIYDKIVAENANGNGNGQHIPTSIYDKIVETTDAALTFNDKYASIDEHQDVSRFDIDLAELGEKLEERFDLEDQLIHTLHSEHL